MQSKLCYQRRVISIVLAATAAGLWGVADFSGGKASQRASPLAVTVVSQLLSLPVVAAGVLLVPGTLRVADVAWGAGAGVAGFAGIVLLYRGLASGAMAVVAPVTAVTAAAVPVAAGLVLDRSPGRPALIGIGCALIAIALVSMAPGAGRAAVSSRLIGLALTSGLFFGVFFVLLGQAGPDTGLWALAGARLGSAGCGVALMLGTATAWRLPSRALPLTAAAGVLDAVANALYLAAAVRGHLSVVAALASLYPASTVSLALIIDRERLRMVQVLGLGLAATALVLASS
jgi:drug/metabolite transporter (DMT)-like permease